MFYNRDFNIDQNNRDYDFCHNRPALVDCVILDLCLVLMELFVVFVTFMYHTVR